MTDNADRLSVELVIAEANGQPVAAAIIAQYGDRAIYLHGGSDHEYRALMAPHLLHWRVMQRARAAGQKIYDMGGVAPEEPERANSKSQTANRANAFAIRHSLIADSLVHPWAGITRFKMGFGGDAVHYPPAVDVVIDSFKYQIYQLGRKLNRSFYFNYAS